MPRLTIHNLFKKLIIQRPLVLMRLTTELRGVGQLVQQARPERSGDGDQRPLHLPRHWGRHPLQGGQQHQDCHCRRSANKEIFLCFNFLVANKQLKLLQRLVSQSVSQSVTS